MSVRDGLQRRCCMTDEVRIQELERRVAALEEALFRTHKARKAIESIIKKWPGDFSIQQIESALKEFFPDVARTIKPYGVDTRVRALVKAGALLKVTDGTGCVASIYRLIGEVPNMVKPGRKYNRQAEYESGFRNIVRTALRDLPEQFNLADLRKWMADNIPDVKIPYGSISSTLYKLQQQDELVVVKKAHTVPLKIYARGSRVVMPSGEEAKAMELAWETFKKEMEQERSEAA
jgi:hypothetical protein